MQRRSRLPLRTAAAAASVALVLAACAAPSPAPSPSDSPTGYLGGVIQSLIDQGAVSGLVQVRWPGAEWSKAYGVRDLDTRAPAQPGDRTQLAADSMTAVAVLHLVEEGRIALDTPVNPIIPGFDQTLRPPGPVTVWQLHTDESGIPDFQDALFPHDPDSLRSIMDALQSQHLTMEHALELAGTLQWHASDVGRFRPYAAASDLMVLGLLVQTLRNRPFADVVREEVIDRLGLAHTSISQLDPSDPDLQHGYLTIGGRRRDDTPNAAVADTPLGGVSTVADLNTFYAGLLQGRAVSRASLAEMEKAAGYARYGLGIGIWDDKCSGTGRYGGSWESWGYLVVSTSSSDGQYQATVALATPPMPTHLEDPTTSATRDRLLDQIQTAINAALDGLCRWRG